MCEDGDCLKDGLFTVTVTDKDDNYCHETVCFECRFFWKCYELFDVSESEVIKK